MDQRQLWYQIVNAVDSLMKNNVNITSNPQLYSAINHQIVNNPQVQSSLMNHVANSYNQWQMGIDNTTLYQIIAPWLSNYSNMVIAQLRNNQSGMMNPQMAFMSGGMNQQSAGILYGDPQNNTQAPNVQQLLVPNVNNTNANAQPQTQSPATRFDENEALQFASKPTDLFAKFKDKSVTAKRFSATEGPANDIRYAEFEQHRCYNNAIDARNATYKCISPEYFRSNWMHEIKYRQLVHVPMDTARFTELTNQIHKIHLASNTERYNWEDVLELLGACNQTDWNIINTAVVKEINDFLYKYLRLNNTKRGTTLSDINDIKELVGVDNNLVVAEHVHYPFVINQCLSYVFRTIFNPENIIQSTDKHFGDFISCNDIEYYQDDFTERDYGVFTNITERDQFIKNMMKGHTVLRIPRRFISTNCIDQTICNFVNNSIGGEFTAYVIEKNTILDQLLSHINTASTHKWQILVTTDKTRGNTGMAEIFNIGKTLDGQFAILP